MSRSQLIDYLQSWSRKCFSAYFLFLNSFSFSLGLIHLPYRPTQRNVLCLYFSEEISTSILCQFSPFRTSLAKGFLLFFFASLLESRIRAYLPSLPFLPLFTNSPFQFSAFSFMGWSWSCPTSGTVHVNQVLYIIDQSPKYFLTSTV